MVESLKSELLITSRNQLDEIVDGIQNLSLPNSVRSAEIRALVKKQVLIRSCVYNQQVSIFLSHQGIAKSIDQILNELSKIIIQNPLSVQPVPISSEVVKRQQLMHVFDKPSLLTGVKINHKFEIDDAGHEEWYLGSITHYRKGQFTISYETAEICLFTLDELKEDYLNGDFWIL